LNGDGFSVRNPRSKAEVNLTTRQGGQIALMNAQGQPFVGLKTLNPNGGEIVTLNPQGENITRLAPTAQGEGLFQVNDADGIEMSWIAASQNGGKITLRNRNYAPIVTLEATPTGYGQLSTADGRGRICTQMGYRPNDLGPFVGVWNPTRYDKPGSALTQQKGLQSCYFNSTQRG
jgi:hypothetical protein